MKPLIQIGIAALVGLALVGWQIFGDDSYCYTFYPFHHPKTGLVMFEKTRIGPRGITPPLSVASTLRDARPRRWMGPTTGSTGRYGE